MIWTRLWWFKFQANRVTFSFRPLVYIYGDGVACYQGELHHQMWGKEYCPQLVKGQPPQEDVEGKTC